MSSSLNYKSQRNFLRLCGVAPLLVGLTACGLGTVDGGSTGVAAGEDGGACFANDTCNAGLICNASQICRPVGADPCIGVACSGHGSCVTSGTPAVASCDCDTDFYAVGLTCLANDVAPMCATPVTTDSTYSGYATAVLDDGVVDARGGTVTTWASSDGAGTAHFVELQFARAISISEVQIFWAWNSTRSTYATSQAVDVTYWNGSAFATAGTFTRSGASTPVSTVTFAAVQTTRLRLEQAAGMGPADYPNVMWLTEVDYGPTAACLTSCGVCGSYCGDGTCDAGESDVTCSADCAASVDPCDGQTCSGHGTCVASGTPAVASCNCAANYHAVGLTCVADVTYQAVLTWEPPTTNTDDSPLTDLAGYRLYWGTSTSAYSSNQDLGMPSCADVAGTMTCTYTLAGLGAGSYFFAVTAYNTGGYASVYSNEATKTF
mgnify:CR=1 FL=1